MTSPDPLQHIIDDCGLNIYKNETVYGGDINRAYCLHAREAKYFLKVNNAKRYPGMLEKEMNGLHALNRNSVIKIPQVFKSGNTHGEQYLLLEWIERGSPQKDYWQKFGGGLAMLHQKSASFFGWEEDNFIGSLAQHNQQYSNWDLFYTECRIMPLVKYLFDAGSFSGQDLASAMLFCKRIEQLFPVEPPALLHGDLWSGNFMITGTGYPSIFDPAIYYGHREMDIGMTRLFGGFDPQFYKAYGENYPLVKGWEHRLQFTQLYPILVHAVLFGAQYITGAKNILKQFAAN